MTEQYVSKELFNERTNKTDKKLDGVTYEFQLLTRSFVLIEETTRNIHDNLDRYAKENKDICIKINSHERFINTTKGVLIGITRVGAVISFFLGIIYIGKGIAG